MPRIDPSSRVADGARLADDVEIAFAERLKRTSAEFAGDPIIGKILSFIHEGGKRPLMMAALDSNTANPDAAP